MKHPSGDVSFRILDAAIKRYQYQQDALIEILHSAQDLFGYLDTNLLLYIAHSLKLPPSRVYGVATFYHLFSMVPKGVHHCVVCTGTACYVKGADALLSTVEQFAHLHAGETTANQQFSISTARCLGTCGLAPIVVIDDRVHGYQTPGLLRDRLRPLSRRIDTEV
ncbi:bidirectional hydrogenase complex protein HoxE [Oscillatoria sp. FACHB-1407]|uniref:bidirectional hydrogenase complex protein HoxE n=1 Tax=Oscillatoria sp. FACHB-1407 TaxID=2692847 RepID=UPI00168A1FD0|nr:bidirectional hydrogenase complex protein HoxE [Oscillatoria sp. FACHB-1407]MBD2464755.1 bidirectional hydrogenase complex protein HoxE [Oscillatoria sp. FACHB-1407]